MGFLRADAQNDILRARRPMIDKMPIYAPDYTI